MFVIKSEEGFAQFRDVLGINASFSTCLAYTNRDGAISNACEGTLGAKRKKDVEEILVELFGHLEDAIHPHVPPREEMACRESLARKLCCLIKGGHLVGDCPKLPDGFKRQKHYILHRLNKSIAAYLKTLPSRLEQKNDAHVLLATERCVKQEDTIETDRACQPPALKLPSKVSRTPRSPESSSSTMDPDMNDLSFASASSLDSESGSSVFSPDDYTTSSIYSRETTPTPLDRHWDEKGLQFDRSNVPGSPSQRPRRGDVKLESHDTKDTRHLENPYDDDPEDDIKRILSKDYVPASSSQVKDWARQDRPVPRRHNAAIGHEALRIPDWPIAARRKSFSGLSDQRNDEDNFHKSKSVDLEEGLARLITIDKKTNDQSKPAKSNPILKLMRTMREPIQSLKSRNGGWIYVFSTLDAPDLLKIGLAGEEDELGKTPTPRKRHVDGSWHTIIPGDNMLPAERERVPGRVIRRLTELQTDCELGEVRLEFYAHFQRYVQRMEALIHKTLHHRAHAVSCLCGTNHTEWFRTSLDEALPVISIWQRFFRTTPYSDKGFVVEFWQKHCTSFDNQSVDFKLPIDEWIKSKFIAHLDSAERERKKAQLEEEKRCLAKQDEERRARVAAVNARIYGRSQALLFAGIKRVGTF